MATTIEVRFKGNRKDYYTWDREDEKLHPHQAVIVQAERGLDLGRVGAVGDTAAKKCAGGCATGCGPGAKPSSEPQASVVRVASQQDIRIANDLRRSENQTRLQAIERVKHYGLEMKVSDAEWQWDKKRLLLFFTAEKRVDFRDLVRDLATMFKTRIELRQIGVRDEAARLGGVGRCGKEYCCSTWLKQLDPISLSLAKDQHLSLNPAQISGGCGRLLCCLKYEHEFYVSSRKRFPKEGKTIRTTVGAEKVVAVDIFKERVFLRSEEHGPRILLLVDLQAEVDRLGETLPLNVGRRAPGDLAAEESPPVAAPSRRREARPDHGVEAAEAVEIGQPTIDDQPLGEKRRRRRKRKRSKGRDGGPGFVETPEAGAATGNPGDQAADTSPAADGGAPKRKRRRRRRRRPDGSGDSPPPSNFSENP